MDRSSSDTIAAPATPPGRGALAIVRVSGPLASRVADDALGSGGAPRLARHADYRAQDGTVVDDVVATLFRAPASYTGEDLLELSCHGNPLIVNRIMDDLCRRGCRVAEPGEFTRRAFLGGRMDLAQAEAVQEMIHARSERALEAARQQLRGSLRRHLEALTASLLQCLAQIEAYIDFPEEDLPAEDKAGLREGIRHVLRGTQRLLATQAYGDLLREGIRTVILGESNAGKSSLLNRLVGFERALVSAEPGTTRDFIEEPLAVGGHLLRLTDTAGLNPSPGDLERQGIARTHDRVAEADLVLWVWDVTRPAPVLPAEMQGKVTPGNTLILLNKIDLRDSVPALPCPAPGFESLEVSVRAETGLPDVIQAVARRAEALRADQGDEVLAINARHADALRRAAEGLEAALAKLTPNSASEAPGFPAEFASSDLRLALDALGEIGGRIDNERMLDALFKTFCIGK